MPHKACVLSASKPVFPTGRFPVSSELLQTAQVVLKHQEFQGTLRLSGKIKLSRDLINCLKSCPTCLETTYQFFIETFHKVVSKMFLHSGQQKKTLLKSFPGKKKNFPGSNTTTLPTFFCLCITSLYILQFVITSRSEP